MTIPYSVLPRAARPLYFPGQLLTADDLTAEQEVDTGLRRLHHRMLHGWGIASGLTVTGRLGDSHVVVGQGYALDGGGRELVLPEGVAVPIPPVSGGATGDPVRYLLVIRWTEDADADVTIRGGVCATEGAVRRSDAPTLGWMDAAHVRVGADVVLAEAFVQNCRLSSPPDGGLRRLLNPPPTPYAASGATLTGGTTWRITTAGGVVPCLLETEVDTAEAGFGDTPAYLVRILGERSVTTAQSPINSPFIVDGTPYVDAAEPGRFRVTVPLVPAVIAHQGVFVPVNPVGALGSPAFASLVSAVLAWSVEWIGVQS